MGGEGELCVGAVSQHCGESDTGRCARGRNCVGGAVLEKLWGSYVSFMYVWGGGTVCGSWLGVTVWEGGGALWGELCVGLCGELCSYLASLIHSQKCSICYSVACLSDCVAEVVFVVQSSQTL